MPPAPTPRFRRVASSASSEQPGAVPGSCVVQIACSPRAARLRTPGSSRACRNAAAVPAANQAVARPATRSVSRSVSQTSSAASSVQPPAKDRRGGANAACSSRVEQLVAPLDRRAQRLLALGRVARAAGEQSAGGSPSRSSSCSGGSATGSRRRELDREREAVEAPADLDDGSSGGSPAHRARARRKSWTALAARQRGHGVLVLGVRAAARHGSWRAAVKFGQRASSICERGRAVDDAVRGCRAGAAVRRSPIWLGERLAWRRASARCARQNELGVAERGERHPEDAVGEVVDELGRGLEGEPRLAGAAGAGERDQARAVAQRARPTSPSSRSRPTSGVGWHGQVGRVERAQRRELARRRAGRGARARRGP